ncbi:hypothetical protein [Riemerella columbina]|uniref:hypothetical protein n=1 Tax=Riemerella columbina TaxID=103810 RepID=UPI000364C2BB|nr:hypothetical protein [Riemerella columbina]
MNSTATKVQKISDIVFQELKKQGFSKYFNWIDYNYFKKNIDTSNLTDREVADKIVSEFINYHSDVSDFAEYEF